MDNQKEKNMNASHKQNNMRFGLVFKLLIIICSMLFVVEFFIKKKTSLAIEAIPGLHASTALVAIFIIVFGVRILRSVLSLNEDYYAPSAVDSERYPQKDTKREVTND